MAFFGSTWNEDWSGFMDQNVIVILKLGEI